MQNKRKNILLIILIITIITTIFIIVKINKKVEPNNIVPVKENTVIPENSYLFFGKYVNGQVTSKEFYEVISDFYQVTFPTYYKDLKNKNAAEVSEYYNSNKEKIHNDFAIVDKNEFLKLVGIVQNLKSENLVLESLTIVDGKIIERTDYTISIIKIKYEGNMEIEMMVKVYKTIKDDGKNIEFSLVK